VCTSGLDHADKGGSALCQYCFEVFKRREQPLLALTAGGQLQSAGNHVVAALAQVDVIVGMHPLAGEPCQHLVRVHVAAGAGAGLEDVDRELVAVRATDNCCGGTGDRRAALSVEKTEFDIDFCSGLLDEQQGLGERAGQWAFSDTKIVHRTLRLRPVERPGRH
jgi:hypothetical protein